MSSGAPPKGGERVRPLAVALLRRVVAAGKADRFGLRQVCPADATRYLTALELLVELGCAERVVERPGEWHYRLSEAGRSAAASGALPPPPYDGSGRPSATEEGRSIYGSAVGAASGVPACGRRVNRRNPWDDWRPNL